MPDGTASNLPIRHHISGSGVLAKSYDFQKEEAFSPFAARAAIVPFGTFIH